MSFVSLLIQLQACVKFHLHYIMPFYSISIAFFQFEILIMHVNNVYEKEILNDTFLLAWKIVINIWSWRPSNGVVADI